MSQAKKQKTDGDAGPNESTEKQYYALNEIQTELFDLNEQASKEVLEVEKRYNGLRQPLYEKRFAVIDGIKGFWAQVFTQHPELSEYFQNDDDAALLEHLTNVSLEDKDDDGFKVTFHFSENPYFTNRKLEKNFTFDQDGLTKSSGTAIDWKPGKNFVEKAEKEGGSKKRDSENVLDSFFSWFGDEDDFDNLADLIKEDIWLDPSRYLDDDDDDESDGEDDEVAE